MASDYLRAVCDYVHLNAVRARLTKARASLQSYRRSSYVVYLEPADSGGTFESSLAYSQKQETVAALG